MTPLKTFGCTLALFGLGAASLAAAPVDGTTARFTSPNGLEEACIRIAPMPGAEYSKHDLREEAA